LEERLAVFSTEIAVDFWEKKIWLTVLGAQLTWYKRNMFILPSIFKDEIPPFRLCASDWYLIFVIYLMPTAFLGFLPNSLLYVPGFMDYRLLTFMFAVPLVFIGPRKTNNDFGRIPGIWALCLVGMTVVLRTAWSLYSGVSLFEVVAVLRWNFTWPIFAVCVLHYASRLPASRLYGVLRMFLLLYSLQVCLVTVSLVTGVDFFLNKNTLAKSLQYIDQGLPVDNLRVFPLHIFIGTALLTMGCMVSNRLWTYYILLALSLSLPLLYTRRMYTIILFIQTLAIYLPCCFLTKKSRPVLFYPFIFLCLSLLVYSISPSPSRIDRFIDRMLPAFGKVLTAEKTLTLEEVGTYSVRMRLLEDAIQSTADNKRQLTGMGYKREYNAMRPGTTYSYVTGEDSFVAPVIFCEGWGGLCLRILPYLLLLLHNVKRLLLVRDRKLKIYSVTAIGVILAQIPAYLQTALICHYDYFYIPLVFVELLIVKGQKSHNKSQMAT
jgi:hypothetical protein